MRVLIADDDLTAQAVLRAALCSLGHEVAAVADGEAALEALAAQPYPLVITDWLMPRRSGLELCRAVREGEARRLAAGQGRRYTHLILLTSLGGRENYLEGMDAGADDLLTKPFDPQQLAARLRVAERIIGLTEAVEQLSGLLPICSYCKKIRDEAGGGGSAWIPIESYVSRRTDAAFSHGVCPSCYREVLEPQLAALRRKA